MGACTMQPDRTIRRARRLRKTPTRAEEFFWSLVRDKAVEGLRFRRQVPIGAHVVDFACLSARLIIEADGGVHELRTYDDAKRDAWLTSQGFQVLRFRCARRDPCRGWQAPIRAATPPTFHRNGGKDS